MVTTLRLDNVGIVVDDLVAATTFFTDLGLTLAGQTTVEGEWVDHVVGLTGTRCRIAMLRTPDGHSQLELSQYENPTAHTPEPLAPNTVGFHRVALAVDDVDAAVEVARSHGAELLGDVVRYQDSYRLCYLRGPAGIVVMLAEELA
jgi:catechol 2,3-dioxygenase-like lactoylglutathione lyase family enzyme